MAARQGAHGGSATVHSGKRATTYKKERQNQHPPGGARVGNEGRPGEKMPPPHIVRTTLRPDTAVWSEQAKKVILLYLTVPWEEGCDEAHERKRPKYQDLVQDSRERGWCGCFP